MLNLPISTVHYHLQKLQEANLISAQEFHYSQKGREVLHYKLANKYIIIAPKHVSGLKEKLKGILPAALAALGISAVIKLVQRFSHAVPVTETMQYAADSSESMIADVAPEMALKIAAEAPIVQSQPDIAVWFLVGSLAALVIYVVVDLMREKARK